LQRFEQPQPTARARLRGLVQAQLKIHIDQAGGVLGALQVTAHPVQTVRDSGEHCRSPALSSYRLHHARRTQVSLLPPPCDELTTSDPRRSATRVSPPGTRVTFSP